MRVGIGIARLNEVKHANRSLTLYWFPAHPDEIHIFDSTCTSVQLTQVIGERYPNARVMQILRADEAAMNMAEGVEEKVRMDPHRSVSNAGTEPAADRLSTINEERTDEEAISDT